MVTLGLLFAALLAQGSQNRPVFSSRADLVVLHVSVLDRHQGFVSGLGQDQFAVSEDGTPQPIALFEHDDTAVSVGLIIDSSGSMLRRRDSVIAAGMAFAASSNAADELFTINFNENIWPGLERGHDFTSDPAELRAALDRSGARGETALFDAVAAGLHHLDRGHQPRKVLIVVSDGGDNASHTTFDAVMDTALRSDVVIYAIGIYDNDDRDANPKLLRRLAEVTGGEAFFPKENAEVTPVLERIARDIRASYTIGFTPAASRRDGPHKVRVDVRTADHRKLTVRARSAYIGKLVEAERQVFHRADRRFCDPCAPATPTQSATKPGVRPHAVPNSRSHAVPNSRSHAVANSWSDAVANSGSDAVANSGSHAVPDCGSSR